MNAADPPRRLSEAEGLLNLPAGTFPFASHWLDTGEFRLHYVNEGSGPTLLMLHGNPTWSYLYRHLIKGLRQDFNCVALDLPGFGLSQAPQDFDHAPQHHVTAVIDLVRHLGLHQATLVAHDWGGPIGLSAALAAPQAFGRFVLGNTWGWPVNGQFHFEWFSRLMGGPAARWVASEFNPFVNLLMPGFVKRQPLTAASLQAYRAPFLHSMDVSGTHRLPAQILGAEAFLSRLEVGLGGMDSRRFLFLWPDSDRAFRGRERQRWARILPLAQFQTLRQCGHYPWEEAPYEVIAAIRRWNPARNF